MKLFSVTFEIVTHESAENGETEEHGFVVQDVSLREALRDFGNHAQAANSWPVSRSYPPRWLIAPSDKDYATGAEETRSLHFPRDITPSSAIRIARMLGLKIK